MIKTPLIEKAEQIARKAHEGQTDKAGQPYILHPLHVAGQMKSEEEIIVALLHDVVEDSDITLLDLRKQGFSYRVVDALSLLTHEEGVDYFDYIRDIKFSPLATAVKLADLQHNSDLTRLVVVDDEAKRRVEKYEEAIKILRSCKNLRTYGQGSKGDVRYFKTELSTIFKVEDGVMVYSLKEDGEFTSAQSLISLWYGEMTDYKPISEEEVDAEIEIRKTLSAQ